MYDIILNVLEEIVKTSILQLGRVKGHKKRKGFYA